MVGESIGQNRHVAAPATNLVFRPTRIVFTHLAIVDLADIADDHTPFIASENRRETALLHARRGNHHRLTPSLTLVTRVGVPWLVIGSDPSRVHISPFIHRNRDLVGMPTLLHPNSRGDGVFSPRLATIQ